MQAWYFLSLSLFFFPSVCETSKIPSKEEVDTRNEEIILCLQDPCYTLYSDASSLDNNRVFHNLSQACNLFEMEMPAAHGKLRHSWSLAKIYRSLYPLKMSYFIV